MSLVSIGRGHLGGALRGAATASKLEEERNIANEQLDEAEKARTQSSALTGAGIGLAVGLNSETLGAAVGGPVGAGVGMLVGFLVGELF